jgi:hypothetical protein
VTCDLSTDWLRFVSFKSHHVGPTILTERYWTVSLCFSLSPFCLSCPGSISFVLLWSVYLFLFGAPFVPVFQSFLFWPCAALCMFSQVCCLNWDGWEFSVLFFCLSFVSIRWRCCLICFLLKRRNTLAPLWSIPGLVGATYPGDLSCLPDGKRMDTGRWGRKNRKTPSWMWREKRRTGSGERERNHLRVNRYLTHSRLIRLDHLSSQWVGTFRWKEGAHGRINRPPITIQLAETAMLHKHVPLRHRFQLHTLSSTFISMLLTQKFPKLAA